MAMMVVLAAVLLIYEVSPGIAREAHESDSVAGENCELQLDMANNSVDDMYDGCEDKMNTKIPDYLKDEKNKTPKFKEVWDSYEKLINKKRKRDQQKDQIVAIRTYIDKSGVYRDFNNAVRTQGPQYNTGFRYHALHFFLTTAIKAKAKKKKTCLTCYRRVNVTFSNATAVKNKEIRFGSFTSASLNKYADENQFGNKSCFEIFTCMGVDISIYSKYPSEREVLIPPYEVFEVVEITNRSENMSGLPCEVVYKVNSTGKNFSKLNCSL